MQTISGRSGTAPSFGSNGKPSVCAQPSQTGIRANSLRSEMDTTRLHRRRREAWPVLEMTLLDATPNSAPLIPTASRRSFSCRPTALQKPMLRCRGWSSPRNTRGKETDQTPPLPPARGAASPSRVNITNSAGFRPGCLPYARRNTNADIQRPSPGLQSQCEGLTTKEESRFPMDTQNLSAPSRAQSGIAGKTPPTRAASNTTTPATAPASR